VNLEWSKGSSKYSTSYRPYQPPCPHDNHSSKSIIPILVTRSNALEFSHRYFDSIIQARKGNPNCYLPDSCRYFDNMYFKQVDLSNRSYSSSLLFAYVCFQSHKLCLVIFTFTFYCTTQVDRLQRIQYMIPVRNFTTPDQELTQMLNNAKGVHGASPSTFHLMCKSLHRAAVNLYAMVHRPVVDVFFSDEVEDKIYFVSADSRKVEDCALLQQIRLVENLAEGVLRRYHAAPCFQTMLVSCVTELEFSIGVVNRVFHDEYLARYILEYAYALPKMNRSATTRIFDEHRRYLENTFCVRMSIFYDYCQSMFVSYNRPPEEPQQEHEEEDGEEGQELANKKSMKETQDGDGCIV
jgi:hypothetical protein